MMGQRRIDTSELFTDLYRANERESLYELGLILDRIEALPKPFSLDNKAKYAALCHLLGEAVTAREHRLCELRRRYEALPKVAEPAEKEEV